MNIPKDLIEVPLTLPEFAKVLELRKKKNSIAKRIKTLDAKKVKLAEDWQVAADAEGTILANADGRKPVEGEES